MHYTVFSKDLREGYNTLHIFTDKEILCWHDTPHECNAARGVRDALKVYGHKVHETFQSQAFSIWTFSVEMMEFERMSTGDYAEAFLSNTKQFSAQYKLTRKNS